MIEVKGLYKSFEGKTVLHNIDATFENGKTSLIIGQSGSGKTVLMKCIVGLLTPEKGEVLYDGRNFLAMGKKEKKHLRREMGMIFQSAALFDSMSVLDNVMFPLNMFGSSQKRYCGFSAMARAMATRFCIPPLISPGNLSLASAQHVRHRHSARTNQTGYVLPRPCQPHGS